MAQSYVEKLQTRKRRVYTALILIGCLGFLSFIALSLFGESGILVNMRANRQFQELEEERNRLLQENRRLQEEIRALHENPRRIEAISRSELGFGRPGEIIFHFPEDEQTPVTTWKVEDPAAAQPPQTPLP